MPPVVQFCSRKTSYLHCFETAEFSKYAERVIKDEGIQGYSLVVVHCDGGVDWKHGVT